MPTKEELVIAARAGDRQAFAALVEADGATALRLARSILHSSPEAEDAVQEAFVRAWRDLPRLRDPARWPAWLRTLTVRAAIDRYRGLRRLREVELDAAGALIRSDGALLGMDDRDRFRRAVAGLSMDDRVILALRFGEDLDVPTIAATLGIRLGTAKARLHRATVRVRERLGDD